MVLKDLISKGTADSLTKLSDEELGRQQLLALEQFMILSVRQAAIALEQKKRDLEGDDSAMKEYMEHFAELIAKDEDLFNLKEG